MYTVSQKVPTFKLSITLSNRNLVLKLFALLESGKCIKFATKPIQHYPPHLSHVARLPWDIKNSVFCRYSADMEEIQESANQLHFIAYNFVIHPQIWIFSAFKIAVFPILIAYRPKLFCVTVLLLVYFCDQSVAPEIRHCRRHCSVSQQSTWYSETRTRF